MQVIQPVRVERTYIQRLHASPEEVFPLLCPVRETEWVDGWNPLTVYSRSGVVERDCVFTTGEEEPESYWMVTERDTSAFKLVIVKTTPGMTMAKITIVLMRNEEYGTDARVTYLYIALSEAGEEFVRNYTDEYYLGFMQYWEGALNEHLQNLRNAQGEAPPDSHEEPAENDSDRVD